MLHSNCHEMADLGSSSYAGGLGIIFHTCTFFFSAWRHCHIQGLARSNLSFLKKKKKSSQILPPTVCASLGKSTGNKSLEAVHTSFAGAWHAHFCDGGDDGVVPVAFANQVDYPVCDLFNGAPVQTMVLCGLEVKKKKIEV